MKCETEKGKGGLRLLLVGMLAGLTAGLLLAPRPGAETLKALLGDREELKDIIIRRLPV